MHFQIIWRQAEYSNQLVRIVVGMAQACKTAYSFAKSIFSEKIRVTPIQTEMWENFQL